MLACNWNLASMLHYKQHKQADWLLPRVPVTARMSSKFVTPCQDSILEMIFTPCPPASSSTLRMNLQRVAAAAGTQRDRVWRQTEGPKTTVCYKLCNEQASQTSKQASKQASTTHLNPTIKCCSLA
jgi:hypothetical protein